MFQQFGIGLSSTTPVDQVVEYSREAERLGFGQFWVAETYHANSAVVTTASLALATKTIMLGLGIISPHTRHPALIAMESATLHHVSKGRFILGLGPVRKAMTSHGLEDSKMSKPARTVRECVEIVRQLLMGKKVVYEGQIFNVPYPGIRLTGQTRRPPPRIYIAATGPVMLGIAGELGDGLFLNYPSSPEFVRYAVGKMGDAARRSGRNPEDINVLAYLILSVSNNIKAAEERAREFFLPFIPSRDPTMMSMAGISEKQAARIRDLLVKRATEEARNALDSNMVQKLAICGKAAECAEKLTSYLDAGLTCPVFYRVMGPNPRRFLKVIAKEIIPIIKRRARQ